MNHRLLTFLSGALVSAGINLWTSIPNGAIDKLHLFGMLITGAMLIYSAYLLWLIAEPWADFQKILKMGMLARVPQSDLDLHRRRFERETLADLRKNAIAAVCLVVVALAILVWLSLLGVRQQQTAKPISSSLSTDRV